jgi:hypothetical protein
MATLDDRNESIVEEPLHLQLWRRQPVHAEIEIDAPVAEGCIIFVPFRNEAERHARGLSRGEG